jgi:hypothetical protein
LNDALNGKGEPDRLFAGIERARSWEVNWRNQPIYFETSCGFAPAMAHI